MSYLIDLSNRDIDIHYSASVTVELSVDDGRICEDAHFAHEMVQIKVNDYVRDAVLTNLEISTTYVATFKFSGPPRKID